MKAVVVHGAGDLRVDTLPDPTPAAGEVLISMEWGGICGSDLAYVRHGSSGTAVLKQPLVLGHEFAGRIAELGDGVTGLQVGQPVTVHPATLVGDGVLPDRLAGRSNLYPQIRYCGSAAFDPHTDGGFSELKVVRAQQIRVLPENVGTEQGALAEPLAVALGSLVVAAAKYRGAATVTAADISAASLSVATAMGADTVLNLAAGENLPEDAELVFEASGAAAALGAALRATARGGTLVQVGNLPGTAVP